MTMNPLKALRLRERWDGLPQWVKVVALLSLIAVAFYLPRLTAYPMAIIRTDIGGGSDWASVLFLVAIYMIAAVGLNIVVGMAGLLDLGYIGFYALGAYSVALFGSPSSPVTKWIAEKYDLGVGWALPFAATIPIAIALTMAAGVVLGAPTLRLRGDYLAIVTMGFGEIIRIIARNADPITGGAAGVTNVPAPPPTIDAKPWFNVGEPERWYWLALCVLILLIFVARRLENSRVGRAWLAIREDEDAAAIMGVPAFKFKLWAFAMGAAFGAIAGLLFASKQTYVEPNGFALNLSFLFVAMVVIGGSGNIAGAMLGAFLITYLPERFRTIPVIQDMFDATEWRPFAFGVALVAVMVLRPQGLVPNRRRAREFEDRRHEAEEAAVDV